MQKDIFNLVCRTKGIGFTNSNRTAEPNIYITMLNVVFCLGLGVVMGCDDLPGTTHQNPDLLILALDSAVDVSESDAVSDAKNAMDLELQDAKVEVEDASLDTPIDMPIDVDVVPDVQETDLPSDVGMEVVDQDMGPPQPELCGNGNLDPEETCDTAIPTGDPGACPQTCNDGDGCTQDEFVGAFCVLACDNVPITQCDLDSDGCCPQGCDSQNDFDCSWVCGNGVVETGETCDTGISYPDQGYCPPDCVDGDPCTNDQKLGTDCNVVCANESITECDLSSDGCCPLGCYNETDPDCSSTCGNGTVDEGETCDTGIPIPDPGHCPVNCDDEEECTIDYLAGSQCGVFCISSLVTECNVESDLCCPGTCEPANDADCCNEAACMPKTLDGCCPTECDPLEDMDCCAHGECSEQPNGCCPVECDASNDADCCNFASCDEESDGCCRDGCFPFDDADCCEAAGCSLESDGCCPTECDPSNDVDCCDAAGCHKKVLDFCCPDHCLPENDLNCCNEGNCSTQSDGCCPEICDATNDVDCCEFSSCSQVSNGCCPTSCDWTDDVDCCNQAGCYTRFFDECCPEHCTPENDADCCEDASCGFPEDSCCPNGCTHLNDADCCNELPCLSKNDGCCPSACTPANDVDCCNARPCHLKSDACCPVGCTPANDVDC